MGQDHGTRPWDKTIDKTIDKTMGQDHRQDQQKKRGETRQETRPERKLQKPHRQDQRRKLQKPHRQDYGEDIIEDVVDSVQRLDSVKTWLSNFLLLKLKRTWFRKKN
jgi:hypothetical protein